ncbi:unnamed protein product [Cuscuta epithymum]|uniref:AT-hook motif nuclear-localized protein n=2 Tax=Cuscuta epithymum TaxID=186058 RepID=A0AAV0G9R7_9ASTE|nr:unnamed protein product [Cuscuta epithymum]CAH9144323.1 unnamed protein product [Cuscuta epithymum]
MDAREGVGLSGSASYYLGRGGGSGGGGTLSYGSGYKSQANPNIAVQSNVRDGAFQFENQSGNAAHGIDPVKKKRGRPRKYGPDGATNMSLALSTVASPVSIGPKRAKGRPPGSGWKQQLAPLGEWMNSSAGLAFTPCIIQIGVGEDIAAKILAFAQQRPRALCILSANGTISAVTLRPPGSSGATVTYEGRFEMLSLTGSYLVSENGGPRNRTGGLSISISSPDGHVLGGAIGGRLIASSPVQVVVCSFVHGNLMKSKSKTESTVITEEEKDSVVGSASEMRSSSSTMVLAAGSAAEMRSSSSTMVLAAASSPSQDPAPSSSIWPPSSRSDSRAFQTGIDLMRGT